MFDRIGMIMDTTNYDMHIVVFTGRHAVLSAFVEQFILLLKAELIDYFLVDADNPDTYRSREFNEYIRQENVVVFMFNNIGLGMVKDNRNMWKMYDIPVFNFLQDHPRNFGDWLLNPPCDIYAFALDWEHVCFCNEYYPLLKQTFFLPNGGIRSGKLKIYAKRSIDVLYTGECQEKVTSYPEIDLFSDKGVDFYNSTINFMKKFPNISTNEAIDVYLNEKGKSLSSEDKFKLILLSALYIENTVRNHTKVQAMHALDEIGVHVEVYGKSWDKPEYGFSDNITIHDRIDIHELFPIINDAKITLCFTPWFKRGCSEKNFDAMLNGSLCVTDKTTYLQKNYEDGYNIVYFDLNNPKQMAADVKWLLENPESAEKLAMRGFETSLKYDTWECRFKYVLERMQEVLIQRQ